MVRSSLDSIIDQLEVAFADEPGPPSMSLRAADAIDSGAAAMPFDPELDQPTPGYFERYFWGIPHLDAASWRYYIPRLLAYALDSFNAPGGNAVEFALGSLRPPDRDPPRLGSLARSQERAIAAALEELAFNPGSPWQEAAVVALEEYWALGAIYR